MARHNNPFIKSDVPRISEKITQDFIDEWVNPYIVFDFTEISRTKETAYLEVYPKVIKETEWIYSK